MKENIDNDLKEKCKEYFSEFSWLPIDCLEGDVEDGLDSWPYYNFKLQELFTLVDNFYNDLEAIVNDPYFRLNASFITAFATPGFKALESHIKAKDTRGVEDLRDALYSLIYSEGSVYDIAECIDNLKGKGKRIVYACTDQHGSKIAEHVATPSDDWAKIFDSILKLKEWHPQVAKLAHIAMQASENEFKK